VVLAAILGSLFYLQGTGAVDLFLAQANARLDPAGGEETGRAGSGAPLGCENSPWNFCVLPLLPGNKLAIKQPLSESTRSAATPV